MRPLIPWSGFESYCMKLSFIIPIFITILLLSACAPAPVETEMPLAASDTPLPLPSETSKPETSATPTPTATPTRTATTSATPTPDYSQIHLVRTFAVFEQSSQVFLDLGQLEGEYYAIGRYSKLENIHFRCMKNPEKTNELVCKGGGIPFGLGIYFNLYEAGTNQLVYENIVSFTGPIPSPTDVVCEIEPLWESNQGELGCWAITCYQNGQWYGGTGDTCTKPWPFEWKYTYP